MARVSVRTKYPIVYQDDNIRTIYVAKRYDELLRESARIRQAIQECRHYTGRLSRYRNVWWEAVVFYLDNLVPSEIPRDPNELAALLARISHHMDLALGMLANLKTEIETIENIRFRLTFGQVAKRRDPPSKRPVNHDDNQTDEDQTAD